MLSGYVRREPAVYGWFREFDPDGMFRLIGPGPEFAVPKGMGPFRERLARYRLAGRTWVVRHLQPQLS